MNYYYTCGQNVPRSFGRPVKSVTFSTKVLPLLVFILLVNDTYFPGWQLKLLMWNYIFFLIAKNIRYHDISFSFIFLYLYIKKRGIFVGIERKFDWKQKLLHIFVKKFLEFSLLTICRHILLCTLISFPLSPSPPVSNVKNKFQNGQIALKMFRIENIFEEIFLFWTSAKKVIVFNRNGVAAYPWLGQGPITFGKPHCESLRWRDRCKTIVFQ